MRKLTIVVAFFVLVYGSALAQGQQAYTSCQGCHGPTGAGIPGAFPPLAGHVPGILAAKNGRTVLIQTLLYGMQGPITVKGQAYQGMMPAWQQLSDQQIADALNHISTSWNNKLPAGQKPFTAAEVKAQRAKKLTPQQVQAARVALGVK